MTETKKCTCLTDERRAFVQAQMDYADDFPDGAFMGWMEECGIDVSELEVFAEGHDCQNRQRKPQC